MSRREKLKPAVILTCSTVLMLVWWHLGSREFYLGWVSATAEGDQSPGQARTPEGDSPIFASGKSGQSPGQSSGQSPARESGLPPEAAAAVYSFATCLLLLGIVPAAIVKLVFRARLADYGVQLGNRVRTVRSFVILAPGCVLAAYLASLDPAMREAYPLNPSAAGSPVMFGLHALTYLMFYLAWEFHFRGFLQLGLRGRFGDAGALLVQVMASSLLHLGKPGLEVFSAVAGGILWGVIAYRSRSLLSGTLQHSLLGIALDWFICRP